MMKDRSGRPAGETYGIDLMFSGKLLAICIAPSAGAPMEAVDAIELVAGRGLAGDRYAEGRGAFQKKQVEPSQEVTLIEQEALEAAARDYKLELTHAESRRNLLTAGVPLNHLVGRTFTVGAVELEGLELCEPCKYLQRLTGKEVVRALQHRGGLRARVVRGGKIQPGDEIR
jgi:MOSC domain-containing protein YiiM